MNKSENTSAYFNVNKLQKSMSYQEPVEKWCTDIIENVNAFKDNEHREMAGVVIMVFWRRRVQYLSENDLRMLS